MNPIKYSDLITPDGNDTIQQAINELTNLINTFNQAKQTIQASASQMAQSMQNTSGATAEQREQLTQLNAKVAELEKQLAELEALQKKAEKTRKQLSQAQKDEIQLTKLNTQLRNSEKGSYNALSAEYRKALIELRAMNREDEKSAKLYQQKLAYVNKLRGEMNNFNKSIGEYRMEVGHYENALSALPGTLGRIGRAFTSFQALGVAAIGAVIAGVVKLLKMMKDWVQVNAAFEQANANLQSVLGITKKDMEALTDTALALGRSTEWTASQVTSLQMELAKLGFGDASIIAMQKHVLAFATAVGADLGEAANMAGAAIRAFNLTSADSERVMGTLAVAVNKSALTFDRIKYAMGTVFPIAHAFGLEIEDATALLGALANAGFSAESAATATRNMLLNLADANGKLAKRTGGAAKSFEDILEKTKQLRDEGADLAEIFELTDKRSVAAFNALIDGTETAIALRDQLAKVDGELKRIQQTRLDTVTGQTTILKSYWEGLKLSIRESNGFLKSTIQFLQEAVKWANKLFFPEQIAKQTALDKYMERFESLASDWNKQGITDVSVRLEERMNLELDRLKINLKAVQDAEDKAIEKAKSMNQPLAPVYLQFKKQKDEIQGEMDGIVEAYNIVNKRILLDEQERLMQQQLQRAEAAEKEDEETKKQKQQRLKDLQAKVEEAKYEVSIAEKGTEQIYRARVKLAEAERALDMEKNRQAEKTAKRDEKIINDKWDKELILARQATDKEATDINTRRLQNAQQAVQLEIAITKEGTEEMLALRIANLDVQEELEKEQIKKREDYYKLSAEQIGALELAITKKYNTLRLKEEAKYNVTLANRNLAAQQDIDAAIFEQAVHTEREKNIFKLEQEKKRLQEVLRINEMAVDKMTDLEVQAVKETIKKIEAEMQRVPYNDIYDWLGIRMNNETRDALKDVWKSVKDSVDELIDAYMEAADAAVSSAEKQVDSAQKVLDAELEARRMGYANSVDMARKELELAKDNEQKALKEKEKAQKAQLMADTVTQASSLITATANIWSAMGAMPYLALAATALMFGAFSAAKIKAYQVANATSEYGEGTVELLEGGSHASGNDIDMGYDKKTRKRRRAEGGEYFAIINKRESSRHRQLIPDVINSLNDGTFTEKYQRATDALGGVIYAGVDISNLEKDVHAMRKQGEEMRFVDNQGRVVVKYKNLITIKK